MGELVVAIEVGIGIRLENDDFAFRRDTEIDAAVSPDAQGAVDGFADFDNSLVGAVGEGLGENVLDAPAFSVSIVPLGFERGEPRLAFWNFGEYDFAKGKYA